MTTPEPWYWLWISEKTEQSIGKAIAGIFYYIVTSTYQKFAIVALDTLHQGGSIKGTLSSNGLSKRLIDLDDVRQVNSRVIFDSGIRHAMSYVSASKYIACCKVWDETPGPRHRECCLVNFLIPPSHSCRRSCRPFGKCRILIKWH